MLLTDICKIKTVNIFSCILCFPGSFDVYNIETALPKLDLDAIENHLKAAKEAERRVSAVNLFFSFLDTKPEHLVLNNQSITDHAAAWFLLYLRH